MFDNEKNGKNEIFQFLPSFLMGRWFKFDSFVNDFPFAETVAM